MNHGSTSRFELNTTPICGELDCQHQPTADRRPKPVSCPSYHRDLILVQHHSLCDYPALQACAFSVSLHERLPATFINLCNGIGEKGKSVFSVEVTPDAHYIDISVTRQKRREEYVHSNVHWRAILASASLFLLLQTHDTRKANTQPPIVVL